MKAEADHFEAQQNNSVSAGLGQKQTVDFKLKIASASESIMVTERVPLINPENPNTSTTLTARAMENLPNPGGDMTYPLQFAAGALINTAGSGNDFVGGTNGYGNVQFNGLPSLSNGYIVDGLETNDPLTNLNSGLSTNLVLGLNSIAEVTVNTALLCGRPGPVRRFAGQLRHQIRHQRNFTEICTSCGTARSSMRRISSQTLRPAITSRARR